MRQAANHANSSFAFRSRFDRLRKVEEKEEGGHLVIRVLHDIACNFPFLFFLFFLSPPRFPEALLVFRECKLSRGKPKIKTKRKLLGKTELQLLSCLSASLSIYLSACLSVSALSDWLVFEEAYLLTFPVAFKIDPGCAIPTMEPFSISAESLTMIPSS